ncbi:hypothetical protein PYW08_014991 [Mythimna loreyi]|uniref:Uncharacterized protein n=1 Tax=Mythimna loreyi TaxID=667449 RepID=A0ACC2R418_9NEOP|nr:hypothetical protein PYW08_014991 [Mythimna loreyi]
MAPSEKMGVPEEEPLKVKEKPKKKTFKEKIAVIKENITVEPLLICHVIPGVLSRLATQNLNLDKACRVNMQFGDHICDALIAKEETKYLKQELAVQELISGMEMWKHVLLTALPTFLIIFVGAWSDKTGKRKICILLPILGDLLMCISNILSVYFFYEVPVEVTMFFEGFFPAITGSWVTMYMGVFAYISDISSTESRTFRVGLTNLCLTTGGPIGSVLSGILLKMTGYYGVFSISALLNLFSIVYGLVYIKDPERPIAEKLEKNESSDVRGFLKSFFDIKHVKDTCTVAFKKGPNNRRTKSILVLASIAFIYGPSHGEYTVRYLYTRYRFNWDALMYSFYGTFFICAHSLGALISISLFSHRLKWDDSMLGLLSNGSKIVGALYTGLARNTMDMYIAVAVEMFNATSFTALRSISSKLVTSDELGKMTSFFNLMEVVTSMIFGPMYSWIYMTTLEIDAGIVYYVSTVLTIPPLLIFAWFFIQYKKDTARTKTADGEAISGTELQAKKKDSLINSIDLEHEVGGT